MIGSDIVQFIVTGLNDRAVEVVRNLLTDRTPASGREARPSLKQGNIYVMMSFLQKAVRLGEIDLAEDACTWMVNRGHGAAGWKRLRTIAVEDVGLGDIGVMALVLWLAGRPDLHAEIGSLKLASLASALMCQAVKSRDMVDIAYWAKACECSIT